MKAETRKLDSLTCDPANTRKHDDRNVEAIRLSLERFGQQKPIVVNADGGVIAGNGTLVAARLLGWTEIAVVVSGLKAMTAKAYGIADNRTAELANWDQEALAAVLADLRAAEDVDYLAAGFTNEEIAEMTDLPAGADGQEFDESAADEVKMATCPKCGEEFPA